MEILKTAKGQEFSCDYISTIRRPPQAYIRVLNASMAEIATVFSDKTHIAQLICGNTVLDRYTRLVAIIPEMDAVKVVLEKE